MFRLILAFLNSIFPCFSHNHKILTVKLMKKDHEFHFLIHSEKNNELLYKISFA